MPLHACQRGKTLSRVIVIDCLGPKDLQRFASQQPCNRVANPICWLDFRRFYLIEGHFLWKEIGPIPIEINSSRSDTSLRQMQSVLAWPRFTSRFRLVDWLQSRIASGWPESASSRQRVAFAHFDITLSQSDITLSQSDIVSSHPEISWSRHRFAPGLRRFTSFWKRLSSGRSDIAPWPTDVSRPQTRLSLRRSDGCPAPRKPSTRCRRVTLNNNNSTTNHFQPKGSGP